MQDGQAAARPVGRLAPWRGVFASLCTTLLGLGLARFAYTPMIPALVGAHWFSASEAAYLGAANLAGYLAGALIAASAGAWLGVRPALKVFTVLAVASLFACILQGGFAWFFVWRGLAGIAGAGLMVLAAPSALPLLPEHVRGRAGGVIFLGLGLGMVLAGTVLPLLLRAGVRAAWEGIALAGLAMAVAAWPFLPGDETKARAQWPVAGVTKPLGALFGAYMANAIGQVPTILFLSAYVAQRLGQGVGGGSSIWALFGVGALAGPLLAGAIADRIGFPLSLRLLWVTQIAAYAVLAFVPSIAAVIPASMVAGAGVPAAVVLVFGRSQALAPSTAQARRQAWSLATSAFALAQAFGGYGMSYLLSASGRYWILFAGGAGCMALAYAFTAASDRLARGAGLTRPRRDPSRPGTGPLKQR